jgi:ankyrin repeat protein
MRSFDDIASAVYRKDLPVLATLTPTEVNLTDADGRTPLMHAVLAADADPDVVRLLIERGASLDATDRDQRWTALHFAARDQNESLARVLLDAGAAVDPVDVFGNTPLWRSVMDPSPGTAVKELLIERGADPKRTNRHGISPLDLARETGDNDLGRLLEKGRA